MLSAGFDTAIDEAWPVIFEHAGEVQGKLDRVYWVGSFSDEDALKFALGSADDPYAKNSPILGYFSIDETMGCVEKRLKTDDWDKLYTKIDRWYFNSIIKSWKKFAANKKLNTKQISCYGSDSLEKLNVRPVSLLCGPKRKFKIDLETELRKLCRELRVNPHLTLILKDKKVHEINFADPLDFPKFDDALMQHVRKLASLLGNTASTKYVNLPKSVDIDSAIIDEFSSLFPNAKIRKLSDERQKALRTKLRSDYFDGKRTFSLITEPDSKPKKAAAKTVKKKTVKKKVVKKKKATRKKK